MTLRQSSLLIFFVSTVLILSGLFYLGFTSNSISFRYKEHIRGHRCTNEKLNNFSSPQGLIYKQGSSLEPDGRFARLSQWLAPIVSEGTFDLTLIDSMYKQQNITIATTIFAVGKYTRFLKVFLESAELNYFVGFRVHYYVFTDHPEEVPQVNMTEGHQLTVLRVASSNRWQEISLRRMERLEKLIETRLMNEADYVFSLDVDSKFYGHWGTETLSRLVGVIHAWHYYDSRDRFPYERRPESQAYIPYTEGDHYYGGAVIGGLVKEVYRLAKTCREQLDIDASKSIEAKWQEESHLNKYFAYNKPTKLLSPEYLWNEGKHQPAEIKVIRFSQVYKNYAEIRPNP